MLDYLYVFLMSMLPVVELRGAIPMGAAMDLNMWFCFLVAILGNMLPVPFLVLFGGKVLNYFAQFPKFGKPFRKIIEIGEKKVGKMKKTLFAGLLAFVAIPLPGTGAWTGALIAITLGLDLKKSIPPIALGVLIAGVIMMLGSYGVVTIFNVFA
ncbi:MAG: small multi-drug export protein [Clostridia bacterium]|nr:small multi-drug export protein [Clostridia bacterium]MBQ9847762.1 small multi-drug export protein [Clostridia bacterium]